MTTGSRSTSYTYTPSGLAETVTLPGGMVTTYGYDRAQRLTSLTNVLGSTTITSHAYTLDPAGNRTALDEYVSGITTGSGDSFGMTYDGLERLTSVTTTNPESFTLDEASNVTARTGPSATYTIDDANRPTSDGTSTLVWSDADRLTGRGSDTFSYDPLDRLTASTVSGTTRTYAYDSDGLLASRTQGGVTTDLLWDPASSPQRLLAQGSDLLIYGLGPLYRVNGSTLTLFARDGQKSIRAELQGSSVTGCWRYRAYGEIAQSSGASTPSVLGYAGQLLDGSALYYMRARWYDPGSGRFLSRDPLGGSVVTPSTLNRFTYSGASPLTRIDPTGLRDLADDVVEGGACDSECVFRNAVFGRPQAAGSGTPAPTLCLRSTEQCSYYVHGTASGTVEVRTRAEDFLGMVTGVIGLVFHGGDWENTMTCVVQGHGDVEDWPGGAGVCLLSRMTGTLDAILQLQPSGRAADAGTLLRSLYEHAVHFAWLAADPSPARLRKWREHGELMSARAISDAASYGVKITDEDIGSVRARTKRLAGRELKIEQLAVAADKFWGGQLPGMGPSSEATSFRGMYAFLCRHYSGTAHPTLRGLNRVFDDLGANRRRVRLEDPYDGNGPYGTATMVFAVTLLVAALSFGWPDRREVLAITARFPG